MSHMQRMAVGKWRITVINAEQAKKECEKYLGYKIEIGNASSGW